MLLSVKSRRWMVGKQGLSLFTDIHRVRGGGRSGHVGGESLHTRGLHQTLLQLGGHPPVGWPPQCLWLPEHLESRAGVCTRAGVIVNVLRMSCVDPTVLLTVIIKAGVQVTVTVIFRIMDILFSMEADIGTRGLLFLQVLDVRSAHAPEVCQSLGF